MMGGEGDSSTTVVFVETNLGRHVALTVSLSDAFSDLKKKIEEELPLQYPDIGKEVKVESLKARREGKFFCVPDSMHVNAFREANGSCYVSTEARALRESVDGVGPRACENAVGGLIEYQDVRHSDRNGEGNMRDGKGESISRSNHKNKKCHRGKKKRKRVNASTLDLVVAESWVANVAVGALGSVVGGPSINASSDISTMSRDKVHPDDVLLKGVETRGEFVICGKNESTNKVSNVDFSEDVEEPSTSASRRMRSSKDDQTNNVEENHYLMNKTSEAREEFGQDEKIQSSQSIRDKEDWRRRAENAHDIVMGGSVSETGMGNQTVRRGHKRAEEGDASLHETGEKGSNNPVPMDELLEAPINGATTTGTGIEITPSQSFKVVDDALLVDVGINKEDKGNNHKDENIASEMGAVVIPSADGGGIVNEAPDSSPLAESTQANIVGEEEEEGKSKKKIKSSGAKEDVAHLLLGKGKDNPQAQDLSMSNDKDIMGFFSKQTDQDNASRLTRSELRCGSVDDNPPEAFHKNEGSNNMEASSRSDGIDLKECFGLTQGHENVVSGATDEPKQIYSQTNGDKMENARPSIKFTNRLSTKEDIVQAGNSSQPEMSLDNMDGNCANAASSDAGTRTPSDYSWSSDYLEGESNTINSPNNESTKDGGKKSKEAMMTPDVGGNDGLSREEHGCEVFKLPVEGSFSLEEAVCNHGFFMMAPNIWEPSEKILSRPLYLTDSINSVRVSIYQSYNGSTNEKSLNIIIHGYKAGELSCANQQAILKQVCRMLRISEKDEKDVTAFQEMHPKAKAKGFGRLFRSPTLFEDAVKTHLLCACQWKRSLDMAQALCDLQRDQYNVFGYSKLNRKARKSKVLKRKRSKSVSKYNHKSLVGGNFPSPRELAARSINFLKKNCNVGYRAVLIHDLAKRVVDGTLDLDQLELDATEEEACAEVMTFQGYGQFASATLLMCMGFYQRVPSDSETLRHLKEVHMVTISSKKKVQEETRRIYDKYAPFQCLAFWLELSDSYEKTFGKLSELPRSLYHTVAGSINQSPQKKSSSTSG